MASIGKDPGGRKRILFVAGDGSRKTVRLRKCSMRDAQDIERHIDALNVAAIQGQSVKRTTAEWLISIGDTLHKRIANTGLCPHREQREADAPTVAEFVARYIHGRHGLKPFTLANMRQAEKKLAAFMGDRDITTITGGDADEFRESLVASGLAENTIRRLCGRARQFFRAACRHKIIDANPFEGMACTLTSPEAKKIFVPAKKIEQVLAVIPCPQWRLMVALARYGGLRCPSEVLALTWGDVDFENSRFTVRACKTERHEDGGVRIVPMFPELAPHFQAAFDVAEAGDVHCVTRYRDRSANLRTQFLRYIQRAGVEPWPRLFQNLRASRATELADTYPSHVCAGWLGHTETVADTSYRITTDTHFERAISAAQNPAQQAHAEPRNASQQYREKREIRGFAEDCESVQPVKVPPEGLEPSTR